MRKRTQVTARSGFTHIRVCNDCKQPIDQDDCCNCTTLTPFIKGAEVTVVHNGIPFRLAVVGRRGNGAFRLEKEHVWYGFDGRAVAHDTEPSTDPSLGWLVRIRKPEDGSYIEALARAKKLSSDVARTLQQINDLSAKASRHRAEANNWSKTAASAAVDAMKIDVTKVGEAARLEAVRVATEQKDKLDRERVAAQHALAVSNIDIEIAEEEIKRLRESIEAVPADVRTVLNLGGIEALSSYVVSQ